MVGNAEKYLLIAKIVEDTLSLNVKKEAVFNTKNVKDILCKKASLKISAQNEHLS